ncbi:M1 family metallopeptidase [Geobacter pickeringii]|uniref:Peptidase M1 n=1 Tax=Geobacter pickeringii TaxID=345632 RepID=A0A0B5BBI4_9BACT|nr:M1 family aminopeptidase [Geobacter pickeringii]AJE02319.1 peptidase M1 [Geobacter pickeringii]
MNPLLQRITVLLLLAFPPVACAAPDEARVARQEIRVRLLPERQLLEGESVLTLAPGGGGSLSLSLNPAAEIEAVAVGGKGVPFRRREARVQIELPRGEGGAAPEVTVRYRCLFRDPAPERPVVTEDPSYGVSGTITPRGSYLGSDAGWYPAPQVVPPRRIVAVSAPAGTEAITAGRRVARKTADGVTSSVWEEARPTGGLSLSAGPHAVEERAVDGIPLYAYFYPEDLPLADRYLAAAAGYLRFYAEKFGPYPFEKFAVVENFFPTGYGFPSYTLIGATVIRLPFIASTSLPHEIAHSWWGNGVLVDYRRGNWCEGLVTYLADYLLEERKSAVAGRDYRFRILADYASLVGPGEDFPLRRFVGRTDPASRAIGYGKGAMLFHMIRKRIGDEAFFAALRELFRERRFAAASWDDLVRVFSRATGEDQAPFVNPWLDLPGGPRLALAAVTGERGEKGWQVRGTVMAEGGPAPSTVALRVEGEGERFDTAVRLAGGRTPFAVTVPWPPARVRLDPDVDTFRLLAPTELPATVNRIKGSRQLAVVVARGCAATGATLELLLRSLGQEGAKPMAEEGAGPATLAGRDLLVCGLPVRRDLMPALPPGVVVGADAFSVEGTRYDGPGDLLLVAGGRSGAPGRVAALFLPLSADAAEKGAPKITHYGRYGLLVFAGGENRVKETPAPAGGEGVVTLREGGAR